MRSVRLVIGMVSLCLLTVLASSAKAQPTSYQGVLSDGGGLLQGDVELRFQVFDTAAAATSSNPVVAVAVTGVVDGLVSAMPDLSGTDWAAASADGAAWLEIAVRYLPGDPWEVLTPRQAITPSPLAAYALDGPFESVATPVYLFTESGQEIATVSTITEVDLGSGYEPVTLFGEFAAFDNGAGGLIITGGGVERAAASWPSSWLEVAEFHCCPISLRITQTSGTGKDTATVVYLFMSGVPEDYGIETQDGVAKELLSLRFADVTRTETVGKPAFLGIPVEPGTREGLGAGDPDPVLLEGEGPVVRVNFGPTLSGLNSIPAGIGFSIFPGGGGLQSVTIDTLVNSMGGERFFDTFMGGSMSAAAEQWDGAILGGTTLLPTAPLSISTFTLVPYPDGTVAERYSIIMFF